MHCETSGNRRRHIGGTGRLEISYSKLRKNPYSAWWKPMAEAPPVTDRIAIATPLQPGS